MQLCRLPQVQSYQPTVLEVLCLLLLLLGSGHSLEDKRKAGAKAEQLYVQALRLRAKALHTPDDLTTAAELLHKAADLVVHPQPAVNANLLGKNGSADSANTTEPPQQHAKLPTSHSLAQEANASAWWTADGIELGNASHPEALFLLGAMYDAGEGVPADHYLAYHAIRLAAEAGLPEAQAELAFRLSLGLMPPTQSLRQAAVGKDAPGSAGGDSDMEAFVVRDAQTAESLLQYYFAAGGNDSMALLAMGYRHMHGLGVPQSCESAVLYYNPVAEAVVEAHRQPHGLAPMERGRLGLRGRSGAAGPTREQEVLHFQWFADMGNTDAQRMLARLLQQGRRHADRRQALHYFRQAADGGDPDAMAHLGHMYASGTSATASNSTAYMWFKRSADRQNPSGQFGLGYMMMTGQGTAQNYRQAFKYFSAAAEQGHVDAWYHLGLMHLKGWGTKANRQQATQLFTQAAKLNHLLAQYNLAVLHLSDRGACQPAVELLKKVAERGQALHTLALAREAWEAGRHRQALLHYLRAADAGFELGQSNAAWMLSHQLGFQGPGAAGLAVRMLERAAQQGNVDALLSLGDAHYYGRGTPRDWTRAGQVYTAASKQGSAQATFNLGFQHQFGAGLPLDLHLAKRYYDKTLEVLPNALLPVTLALYGLWLHGWWDTLSPYLPGWAAELKSRLLVARPPPELPASQLSQVGPMRSLSGSTSSAGLGLGWLDQALDFGSWAEPDRARRMNDALEGLLVLGLSAALWLVLRRRRSLRAAGQQQPQQQQPPSSAPSQGPSSAAEPPSGQAAPRGAGLAGSEAAPSGGQSSADASDEAASGALGLRQRRPQPHAGSSDQAQAGGSDAGGAHAPFKRLVSHLSSELAQAAGSQPAASAGESGLPGTSSQAAAPQPSASQRSELRGEDMRRADRQQGPVGGGEAAYGGALPPGVPPPLGGNPLTGFVATCTSEQLDHRQPGPAQQGPSGAESSQPAGTASASAHSDKPVGMPERSSL